MTCGIYSITNKNNGKTYIGSSVNIEHRWRVHVSGLNRGAHANRHLLAAWKIYGENAFVFAILIRCSPNELLDSEQRCLNEASSKYNLCPIAGSTFGVHQSWKTRQKKSKIMKGRGKTLETRRKLSEALRGHPVSVETRQKLAESARGHIHSAETRQKMSASHKRTFARPEMKLKMSAAHTGIIKSPETRRKLSEALKGNKNTLGIRHTAEARRNMSEAQKKNMARPEIRKKISEVKKKRFLDKLEGLPENAR